MKNLVIFGAPGSGKGTQSDRLVKRYGFKHISTGDVLRGEIEKGTELGNTAKNYIDNGQLIPDSHTIVYAPAMVLSLMVFLVPSLKQRH